MRQYLLYSSSAHFLLIALLLLLARHSFTTKSEQTYYIDFVGPSSVVTMAKAAAKPGPAEVSEKSNSAAPKAPKTEKTDVNDFAEPAGPLPKPSVLSSGAKLFTPAPAEQEGDEGTPLVADAANFPYPWYITQVREALWNSWTERMPSGGTLRCTVRFRIAKDGSVSGVSVETSSGNRLFDNAAESAAKAAAPFQPLPGGFTEDSLTVHVDFKAGAQQ